MRTREELAEIIALENMNKLIGHHKYDAIKEKLKNILMSESEDEFIKRFEKERGFRLIPISKNRYLLT